MRYGQNSDTCPLFFSQNYANKFNMDIRYEVYNDLNAQANYLALSPISGMDALWSAYNSMIASVNMLNWYFALNGINILLLIARILRLMVRCFASLLSPLSSCSPFHLSIHRTSNLVSVS